MTREERQYFYNKLAQLFNNWANEHKNDSATINSKMIESFVDRHMTTITGQQLLPQDVFRVFLNELSPMIANLESSAGGGVDSELSTTSTNPIQNQAVANALVGKADSSIVSGINTRVGTLEGTIASKADNSAVEALQTGKADKVLMVDVEGDQTIAPNIMYVWGGVTELTITRGDEIADIVNNYMIRFTANEGCNITFVDFALQWYGGEAPTWTPGNTYEISIVDNIALWAEIEA